MRQLSRDPFARSVLLKQTIITEATCAWCGSKREDGRMFIYFTENDGINTKPIRHKGVFCCKSCHDYYHS